MLNRQLLSGKMKNEEEEMKKSPRSPLRDLNGIFRSHCGRSTCSISSSSSSSMSVEGSTGCLRFLLPSFSASKTPLRRSKAKAIPKSAPNGKSSNPSSYTSNKPVKENLPKPKLVKEKLKEPPHYLYSMKYGNKSNPKTSPKPMLSTGTSGSLGDLVFGSEQLTPRQCDVPMVDESGESHKLLKLPDLNIVVESSTPVAKVEYRSGFTCDFDCNPVEEGSTLNTTIRTKTPHVQASASAEIQCGLSAEIQRGLSTLAETPACYGAGHIISGMTDRRKCSAKGILTVGETDTICAKANFFDNSGDVETLSKPRVSLDPLPVKASMRWISSSYDKEDDYQMSDLENGMHCLKKSFGTNPLHSASSPSSGHRIPYKGFENCNSTSTSCGRRTRITLLFPSGSPTYHVEPTSESLFSQEKRKHRYDLAREDSPFSIDSLGSGKVIQTPRSDLRSDSHARSSWLNSHYRQNHDLGSGIDLLEKVLQRASLSPKTQISISDPPGLNFHISDLISPTNSIEPMKFKKTWDNSTSCTSNFSLDDMSPSHMRISWREGLVSRIFEMGEFDYCRCLSDDENDVIECIDGKFKCCPNLDLHYDVGSGAVYCNDFGSSDVGSGPKSDGESKQKFSEKRSNPCVESICTDGSGLFASGDSDWTLCYKNQLFEL